MDNFEEYIIQGEPSKAEKAKVWKMAIGLQQVDGLKPSEYLIATAKQNINHRTYHPFYILLVANSHFWRRQHANNRNFFNQIFA